MPRASRYYRNSKEFEKLFDQFINVVVKIKTVKLGQEFFNDFLTQEEKIMFAKRLALYALIKKGYSPITIKSALNVSFETIRNYTIQMTLKSVNFNKILDYLIKREEMQEFWKKVDKLLKPVDLLLKSKTDMKARVKLLSGDIDH